VTLLFVLLKHGFYLLVQRGIDFFQSGRYILMYRAFAYSESFCCRSDRRLVSDYVLAQAS
jgi:hypothetical protein